MAGISTLGQFLDQIARLKTQQTQLGDLSVQISSGKKTQKLSGLESDILRTSRIGLTNLLIAPANDDGTAQFSNAFVRIQQDRGLYGKTVKPIVYVTPQLFKVRFALPANVASGHYKVSAFLFREGALIEQANVPFEVVPEGMNARLRRFATGYGLLYGLAGVLMALMAGWLATVLLKRE